MDRNAKFDLKLLEELFDNGFMGIEIPERFGGAGMTFTQSCIVIEEIAKVDPAVAVLVDIQNTLINTLFRKFANEQQQETWLPRLATNVLGSFLLSEAGSGSDAFAMKMRADKSSDGSYYTLNGSKLWISNSKEASVFVVFASVDLSAGYKGITAFIVDPKSPGVVIGKKEDKLGIRASSTCEVTFEDCKVPSSNIMGPVGKGYKLAIETLNEGRIGIAAQMVGLGRGSFDCAMKYMLQRKQFGQRIVDFQGVQFQIAEAYMNLEAARALTYNAARLKDGGHNFVREAALAKLMSSQVAQSISSQAIDWLGGVGFTKDYPVEKFYRDSKVGTIYEGTSNMQLQTIANILIQEYESQQ
eukprot:TRINITY_DN29655_c0_g1_i3.p1 TRINITY_DN29655_c0_g1~~TRINITY_DN29655_c0_g1_i3.p1  ORF type:complete len:414 (-),score=122.22 TRINITY_DN29655_c0_g1_i3:24-1094(-)